MGKKRLKQPGQGRHNDDDDDDDGMKMMKINAPVFSTVCQTSREQKEENIIWRNGWMDWLRKKITLDINKRPDAAAFTKLIDQNLCLRV